MKKVTLVAVLAAALSSMSAVAQDHNKWYSSASSDGDKRHSINGGYRFTDVFSLEGSMNRTEWDETRDKGERTQTADKAEAAIVWGKIQYDWNQHLTTYAKAGVGRFKLSHDYVGGTIWPAEVSGSRSLYRTGSAFAVGVELAVTDNMYTNIEYQRFDVSKGGEMDYGEGGTTIGIGYKF
jgi:opacity protein-like surface antigen